MSRKYGWSGAAVAAMREAMIGPAAMEINRRKYDSGDKSILLDVLQRCFVARIDPPEWVKNGMVQSISELNSGLSDANDVFGVDPKTLRSLRDQRLIRKHAVRVHNALFNLRLEGRSMAADDALDQVASD